jgi:hypothetical protein
MYFNYFLPNRTKVTLDELAELGLGYVFSPESAASPRSNFAPRGITNGPGGEHGLMVSLSDEYCGYYANLQTWKQEIGCEYSVGMWTDKRPTPETLQRDNLIDGGTLRLDDGQAWTFPMARHFEEFDGQIIARRMLPARLTRDASGAWYPGEIKERYRELWRLTTAYLEAVIDARDAGDGTSRISMSEIDNLIIQCFQCNYRVSATEIDLLGIYDDHVRDRVLRILTDMDGWAILFKKKLSTLDTGGSASGRPVSRPADDTENTGQPSPT